MYLKEDKQIIITTNLLNNNGGNFLLSYFHKFYE